jgi:hypothetical protein
MYFRDCEVDRSAGGDIVSIAAEGLQLHIVLVLLCEKLECRCRISGYDFNSNLTTPLDNGKPSIIKLPSQKFQVYWLYKPVS